MQLNTDFMKQFLSFLVLLTLSLPLIAFPSSQTSHPKTVLTEDQKVLHVLNRLGFGARRADIERVKRIGIEKYIEEQLNPTSAPNAQLSAALKNYEVLNLSTEDIFAKYPNPGALLRRLEGNGAAIQQQNNNDSMSMEDQQTANRDRREKLAKLYREYNFKPANQIMQQVQSARILKAAYSENQLEEVMVDFWSNHFNVYSQKGATRWFIPSYERDVIRKNALGNFRDLVAGTAQHPAMLFYLDNFQSVAPDASMNRNQNRLSRAVKNGKLDPRIREQMIRRGRTNEQIDRAVSALQQNGNSERGINENYARELMELHTLGVDGGYTSDDIKEVARAFTGWTIYDARGYRKAAANMVKGSAEDRQAERQARQLGISPNTTSGSFVFAERLHDKGSKTVLGQKINEGGIKDGLKVIDILANHPSTARFIAKKLSVKFVSDTPDEELVNKVAAAFTKSKGDIKTTLRVLFSSDEFFAAENYRAKIKTPFELMVSSIRALDANTGANRVVVGLLNRMGEPLYGYQAPTGYPDKAADWVNTGALLERMNFAVALASNRLPQTSVDLSKFDAGSKNETLERAIDIILHGEISASTKSTLLKQLEKPLPDIKLADEPDEDIDGEMIGPERGRTAQNRQMRLLEPKGNPDVFKMVGLILGSPDFQRQ